MDGSGPLRPAGARARRPPPRPGRLRRRGGALRGDPDGAAAHLLRVRACLGGARSGAPAAFARWRALAAVGRGGAPAGRAVRAGAPVGARVGRDHRPRCPGDRGADGRRDRILRRRAQPGGDGGAAALLARRHDAGQPAGGRRPPAAGRAGRCARRGPEGLHQRCEPRGPRGARRQGGRARGGTRLPRAAPRPHPGARAGAGRDRLRRRQRLARQAGGHRRAGRAARGSRRGGRAHLAAGRRRDQSRGRGGSARLPPGGAAHAHRCDALAHELPGGDLPRGHLRLPAARPARRRGCPRARARAHRPEGDREDLRAQCATRLLPLPPAPGGAARMDGILDSRGRGAAPTARWPALREDLRLFRAAPNRDGSPAWMIHDPVGNRFFRIGWVEFEVLSRWSLGDPARIAAAIGADTPLAVDTQQVEQTVEFLRGQQLLRVDDPGGVALLEAIARRANPARWKWLLHNYLFFRIPLVRPQRFLAWLAPRVGFLYTRGCAVAVLAATILGLLLAARQWDVFLHTFGDVTSPAGIAGFALALVFAKTLHELGHAVTATRLGVRVAHMGVAFLVLWPMLYTDTGESWKLAD